MASVLSIKVLLLFTFICFFGVVVFVVVQLGKEGHLGLYFFIAHWFFLQIVVKTDKDGQAIFLHRLDRDESFA